MNKKIIDYNKLYAVAPTLAGKKVLVGGCFDILHIGHIRFLSAAKKQGKILIIALENDEFIKIRKKREPFYPQKSRAEILSALQTVDNIILLPFFKSDDEYFQLVNLVKPIVIAVTQDDPYLAYKEKQAKAVGGEVIVVIERINGYNSSQTIKKLTV